ncbi:45 kDa calcium-binding protein [Parasteatoda tepidariorum]|uniref:45 kDa calcium-binding protein n=1 Tax=Parasteatoda tepidariorum TaxID=114398 RepID=UPI00077FC3BD|nr:45 kDa calcium-binding protein [Parasteatoda tepidariorum]
MNRIIFRPSFCDILQFFFIFFTFHIFISSVRSIPMHLLSSKSNSTLIMKGVLSESLLNYDAIKPPDHLQGIKMERDGHINKNFRKEIILGNLSESGTEDEKLLVSVHRKADTNHDGFLSETELEKWINKKVKEHFHKAVRENFIIFTSLDKDHNGRVSWDEYHVNFMVEQGFNHSYASKHPEHHKTLKRKVKEKILLDKAAWSEAANSDPEALNIDEFLTFRHPEHSHVSLINMVNDIIGSLDDNGDEMLSEQEFMEMPDPDETNHSTAEWKQQRLKEFRESIDVNHDGKVTREELIMYNDPENPVHSKTEARKLIRLADSDRDQLLSLKEVLAKKDVFLGSKMIDTARSFHDEF